MNERYDELKDRIKAIAKDILNGVPDGQLCNRLWILDEDITMSLVNSHISRDQDMLLQGYTGGLHIVLNVRENRL